MKGEAFRESFFSARSAHGPLRQILQRKRMSAFGGTAEVLERALNVEVDPKRHFATANTALRRVHSITSSAMESSPDGTSMPSARAVCRLMASLKFGRLHDW